MDNQAESQGAQIKDIEAELVRVLARTTRLEMEASRLGERTAQLSMKLPGGDEIQRRLFAVEWRVGTGDHDPIEKLRQRVADLEHRQEVAQDADEFARRDTVAKAHERIFERLAELESRVDGDRAAAERIEYGLRKAIASVRKDQNTGFAEKVHQMSKAKIKLNGTLCFCIPEELLS